MTKAKLRRRLDRLQVQGKGGLRAARRAEAHLSNVEWVPTGIREFRYMPWRRDDRSKTVRYERPNEHITTRIKAVLIGPASFVVNWVQGFQMRRGAK